MLDISIFQAVALGALAVCIVANTLALRLMWLLNRDKRISLEKYKALHKSNAP